MRRRNVPLGEPAPAIERLRAIGLTATQAGEAVMISNVGFGSSAKRIGLEVGYDVVAVLKKAEQPSSLIPVGIAFALTAAIAGLQYNRRKTEMGQSAGR